LRSVLSASEGSLLPLARFSQNVIRDGVMPLGNW